MRRLGSCGGRPWQIELCSVAAAGGVSLGCVAGETVARAWTNSVGKMEGQTSK